MLPEDSYEVSGGVEQHPGKMAVPDEALRLEVVSSTVVVQKHLLAVYWVRGRWRTLSQPRLGVGAKVPCVEVIWVSSVLGFGRN